MKSRPLLRWLLLAPILAAAPGCATHALWADANLGTWHQPSSDSQLRIYQAEDKREFVVVYQESVEKRRGSKARAYLLYENASRIERQKHPKFVKNFSYDGLEAVPVFRATNGPVGVPMPPVYAVISTDNLWFTIYSGREAVGTYALPEYRDGMGRFERIALTPLAATADVTMVSGAVGGVAGIFYLLTKAHFSGEVWPESGNWGQGGP